MHTRWPIPFENNIIFFKVRYWGPAAFFAPTNFNLSKKAAGFHLRPWLFFTIIVKNNLEDLYKEIKMA